MRVTVLVNFKFVDDLTGQPIAGSGRYKKEIDMPSAPGGLSHLILNVESWTFHCRIDSISWSQPAETFVVIGTATEGPYTREKLGKDSTWESFPE
jgi:hypothetical protein